MPHNGPIGGIMTTKLCPWCKDRFPAASRKKNAIYCSVKCGRLAYSKASGVYGHYPGMAPGTTGAIGELRVSVDLLIRGYEVFRALSPATSCDIAILKSGALLRVEVRTGYRNLKTGKILFCGARAGRADVTAVVLPDEILYVPPLEVSPCFPPTD